MERMTRRSWGSRVARVVAPLTGLALVAGGLGSGDAHADSARDEIAGKWSQFRAVAVAQGIAYQYTSSGDSLASGARERWGGAISGSLPYGYAMTSESRSAGIASVFWPGFVASHYKDALPILADTVPFAGVHTPDNIIDGVKTVAGAAPAYPFIASTSGSKASEFTAMPPTAVPGGSVSGATMRCDPEAASVHCSGSVAKAGLGAVVAEGIDTVADAVLTDHEVRSVSTVNIANLDILGSVHLGNIRAVATKTANGTTSEVKRTVSVGEASVGGQAVTIDNSGVSLARNPAMKQADYDKANTQMRDALSAAGITIRLFGGAQTKAEGGDTNDEGEALFIGLKFPEYGVPDSFFYWNYWVGGTLNGASGVPVDATQP